MFFFSLRRMCSCCFLISGFLVPWSTLQSVIYRCVREENTSLLASALIKSVESTAEPVVCGAVDLVGSPMLVDIAVALERGLPLEIAVGLSQQAVGDAGSDNALGEVAVFGTEVGAVLPALSTAVRSPRYVSSPLVSTAGADVAVFCASSAVSIGGVSAAFDLVDEPECESVDEPMGSVEGPV